MRHVSKVQEKANEILHPVLPCSPKGLHPVSIVDMTVEGMILEMFLLRDMADV